MSRKEILTTFEGWIISVALNSYGDDVWTWDFNQWQSFIVLLNANNLEVGCGQ